MAASEVAKEHILGRTACAVVLAVGVGLLQYACARPLLHPPPLSDQGYEVKTVGAMALLAAASLAGTTLSLVVLRIRHWIVLGFGSVVFEAIVGGVIWHFVQGRGDGRFAILIGIVIAELIAATVWAPQRSQGSVA